MSRFTIGEVGCRLRYWQRQRSRSWHIIMAEEPDLRRTRNAFTMGVFYYSRGLLGNKTEDLWQGTSAFFTLTEIAYCRVHCKRGILYLYRAKNRLLYHFMRTGLIMSVRLWVTVHVHVRMHSPPPLSPSRPPHSVCIRVCSPSLLCLFWIDHA